MECAICTQVKKEDELVIFSYGAFAQILSILKKTTHRIDGALKEQKNLPVYVCRECMQDSLLI